MNSDYLKPGLAILGAVIGLASVSGAAQDNDELERKLRELNIMDNIFEAAMEEEGGNGRFNVRRIGRSESLYLAGQGMVFTFQGLQNRPVRVQGGAFSQQWQQDMEAALARTRASLERVQQSFPDMDFDFDFDFDYDFDVDNDAPRFFYRGGQSMPQGSQNFIILGGGSPEREAAREMEEAMRDTQEQIRDMQRDIRQLERRIRDDEAENEAAIETEIAQIEARVDEEMEQLNEQRQAYEAFLADMDNARQEQQMAVANETADRLITTLCDYGGTLRTLDDDEHVTLILENVVDNNDQVYVFNFSDIRDCRSADSLKQNAVSYMLRGN